MTGSTSLSAPEYRRNGNRRWMRGWVEQVKVFVISNHIQFAWVHHIMQQAAMYMLMIHSYSRLSWRSALSGSHGLGFVHYPSATCHTPPTPSPLHPLPPTRPQTHVHMLALTPRCASPRRASHVIISYTCARLKGWVCSQPRCVWGKMSEESSWGVREIHRSCSHSLWLAAGPGSFILFFIFFKLRRARGRLKSRQALDKGNALHSREKLFAGVGSLLFCHQHRNFGASLIKHWAFLWN